MSDSIRDQLLKLGLKPAPKPEPKPNGPRPQGQGRPQHGQPNGKGSAPNRHGGPGHKPGASQQPGGKPHAGKPHAGKPQGGKPNHTGPHHARSHAHSGQPGKPHRPRTQEEMDLAKAYALRAQAERAEAEALKKAAEEKARQKKERKERLQRLLDGKALNLPPDQAEHPRHFEHRGKIRRVYVDEAQLHQINHGELGVVQLEARYLVVSRVLAEEVQAFAPDMVAVLLLPGETDTGPEAPESVGSTETATVAAPVALAVEPVGADVAADATTADASVGAD